MPDGDVVDRIVGQKGRKRFTTAGVSGQAFCLRADFKDGRKKRAIAWSHFSDYEWEDLGVRERLTILFGNRIVTIEGHKLDMLYREIDEGKLKTFEELMSPAVQALMANPDNDVVVLSVDVYPSMRDLIAEIKEEREGRDNAPERRFAKRVTR
jgi:hypothetical protein